MSVGGLRTIPVMDRIGLYTTGHAQSMAVGDVVAERRRQDIKWGDQSAGSPLISDDRRLAILVEEVGEVAKELNDRDHDGGEAGVIEPHLYREYDQRLREELVQVAAVAVAFIEAIDAR